MLDFGCRLNLAEGDAIRALGLPDDMVVINSCAVTNEAVRQSLQALRRAARERPGARLVATGCAATLEPARFAAAGALVVANSAKLARRAYPPPLPAREGLGVGASVGEPTGFGIAHQPPTPGPSLAGRGAVRAAHTRLFLPVQTGCDHACTFCIIHRARGAAVSVPVADVVDRVARAVDAGIAEVVLTGVDLTSYRPGLGQLVQRILGAVPGLARLRLSSLDMIEIDAALLDAVAEPRLMPQLHLSLQSGDALVLKRMRRRHTPAQAVALCAALRARRPDLHLAADLIAGFPTETEAMFANTLAHVDACGLSQLHVFPYSARDGTPAARMPQVPADIRRARAGRLRALGAKRQTAALRAQLGRPQRILVEGDGTTGHTEHYLPARLPVRPRGSIAVLTAVAVAGDRLECA